MDDIDPMTVAIDQAAEYLRSALRAGRGASVEPQALSARASDLISVLSRAQEVAMALSEQIETTARTHQLGSDDDTSANEHAARASSLLVQVAGEVAEAGLAADQAWNVLGGGRPRLSGVGSTHKGRASVGECGRRATADRATSVRGEC